MRCEICNSFTTKIKNNEYFYKCKKCSFIQIDYSTVKVDSNKKYEKIATKPSKKLIKRIEYITTFLNSGNILDLGSGTAKVFKALKDLNLSNNFKVVSIDNNEDIVNVSNGLVEKFDITSDDIVEEYEYENFDLVFCSHILEHIPYPKKCLKNWVELVKKNGFIFIETPNVGEITSEIDIEHLSFFNLTSLKKLINNIGNVEIIKEEIDKNGIKSGETIFIVAKKI